MKCWLLTCRALWLQWAWLKFPSGENKEIIITKSFGFIVTAPVSVILFIFILRKPAKHLFNES